MKWPGVPWPPPLLGQLPPAQQRAVVSALILVGTVMAAHRGVLQPLTRQRLALEHQRDTAQHQRHLAGQVEATTQALTQIRRRLPARAATTSLLQELSTVAAAHRMIVNAVTPQPPQPLGRYTRLPIRMEAAGTFADLVPFLHALATASTPIRLDRVEIGRSETPSDEPAATPLDVHLTVSVLLGEA